RDLLPLAHPLVGAPQAAVEKRALLVDPARRAAHLVGEAGGLAEAHLAEEALGLARETLHLLGGLLDHREAMHAHLGEVHALAEHARPLVRPARDGVGERMQLLEEAVEEASPGGLLASLPLAMTPGLAGGLVAADGDLEAQAVEQRPLGGQEGAEHFGEELHALARADPGVHRGRVDLLEVVHVHSAAHPAVDVDTPALERMWLLDAELVVALADAALRAVADQLRLDARAPGG